MIIFTDYDHIKTAFKTTKGKVKLVLVDENDSFFEFLKSGQQYMNRICDIEKISLSCSQEYFADMVSMLIYKAKLNNEEVSYLFSKEICDKIETNLSSCFYDIAVKTENKCKNEIKHEQTKTTSGKTKEQIKKEAISLIKNTEKPNSEIAKIIGTSSAMVSRIRKEYLGSMPDYLNIYKLTDKQKNNNDLIAGNFDINSEIQIYSDEIHKDNETSYVCDPFLNQEIRKILNSYNLYPEDEKLYRIEKIIHYYKIFELYPGVDVYTDTENIEHDSILFESTLKKNGLEFSKEINNSLYNIMLYYKQNFDCDIILDIAE